MECKYDRTNLSKNVKLIRIVPEWNVNIEIVYYTEDISSIRIVPEWNVNPSNVLMP